MNMMAKRKEPQLSSFFEIKVFSADKWLDFGVNVNNNSIVHRDVSTENFTVLYGMNGGLNIKSNFQGLPLSDIIS